MAAACLFSSKVIMLWVTLLRLLAVLIAGAFGDQGLVVLVIFSYFDLWIILSNKFWKGLSVSGGCELIWSVGLLGKLIVL